MSDEKSAYYTGPCSDCRVRTVDTRNLADDAHRTVTTYPGTAYTCTAAADPKFGSVFLLCSVCVGKRERDPNNRDDWRPGPHHDASKVVPHNPVATVER